ncbi:MAG: DUF3105 domain-containing protein [Chloroflexi bacterium]|nr:DUF3105 domain-containing protein [Chloroflexota bacterium]
MSQEVGTKREKRLAAREQRKTQAALAQRRARMTQILVLVVAAVLLVGVVAIGVSTQMFGLMSGSIAPIGRAVALEGADHVADGTMPVYKSRPPASGPHYNTWLQSYGFMDPAPPTGSWLHNLEHGAVAILYNCASACPDLEQQLKDLYTELPLAPNTQRGGARAVILPYTDMDTRIAVVAWGWILEQDQLDKDQILKFYDQRINRGPECQNLRCPTP